MLAYVIQMAIMVVKRVKGCSFVGSRINLHLGHPGWTLAIAPVTAKIQNFRITFVKNISIHPVIFFLHMLFTT